MTLIEVRNSDGVVGRCDERCYDAEHRDCHCVCHGKNHGKGLQQAIDNTRLIADRLLSEYRGAGKEVELIDHVLDGARRQLALFPE